MTGYIEREAALKEFEKVCNVCMALVNKPMCGDCSVADTVRKVKSIPAADVRPVVRGKWLTGNDNPRTYGRIRAMCGRCGAFALAEMVNAGSYKERLSNFCPNCGADMRPAPPKEET